MTAKYSDPIDLETVELEMTSSIYEGFSTAIMVKGKPRTVALCREYGDAVQLMALIERGRSVPKPAAASEPKSSLPPLPAAYAWLDGHIGLSRILVEARALIGVLEVKGDGNNPTILAWAEEVGLAKVYRHDATAWCGLFLAVVAKRAGWPVVKDPLWARNWINFGRRVEDDQEALGDVLVFTRPGGGGHVGLYVGEDDTAFHVLGGNQGDAVSIVRIAKDRLIGARRPKWRTAQPPGVVKVRLRASGQLSGNEA
jgi:uncharacterized protein (TIGR02594 family)